MAFGLPCVAADRRAMPEIVDDGATGRVVDPTDAAALADALLELANPAVARRMGDAAHRRMHERFTWDAVGARILAELEARIPRLAGSSRQPSPESGVRLHDGRAGDVFRVRREPQHQAVGRGRRLA